MFKKFLLLGLIVTMLCGAIWTLNAHNPPDRNTREGIIQHVRDEARRARRVHLPDDMLSEMKVKLYQGSVVVDTVTSDGTIVFVLFRDGRAYTDES